MYAAFVLRKLKCTPRDPTRIMCVPMHFALTEALKCALFVFFKHQMSLLCCNIGTSNYNQTERVGI